MIWSMRGRWTDQSTLWQSRSNPSTTRSVSRIIARLHLQYIKLQVSSLVRHGELGSTSLDTVNWGQLEFEPDPINCPLEQALVTRGKYRPDPILAGSISTFMARPDFLQYTAYLTYPTSLVLLCTGDWRLNVRVKSRWSTQLNLHTPSHTIKTFRGICTNSNILIYISL